MPLFVGKSIVRDAGFLSEAGEIARLSDPGGNTRNMYPDQDCSRDALIFFDIFSSGISARRGGIPVIVKEFTWQTSRKLHGTSRARDEWRCYSSKERAAKCALCQCT